jgi:hypothetical protein
LTKVSSIENSFDKASTLQLFLYYLSFVLVWGTLAFITAMYLMNYEDKYSTLNWVTKAKTTEKISFIIFYILQFPFGLLYGLFSGNYDNGLYSFFINPLFVGWTLQKLLFKTRRNSIKRAFQINFTIWLALVLTITIYVLTE